MVKLNPFELIESSCNWMIDQEDANSKDYIKFIQHISFISSKAKSYKFNDKAHIIYDRHFRKLCEKEGYAAFGAGNQELALRFYSFENLRTKATPNTARTLVQSLQKTEYAPVIILTESPVAFCRKMTACMATGAANVVLTATVGTNAKRTEIGTPAL